METRSSSRASGRRHFWRFADADAARLARGRHKIASQDIIFSIALQLGPRAQHEQAPALVRAAIGKASVLAEDQGLAEEHGNGGRGHRQFMTRASTSPRGSRCPRAHVRAGHGGGPLALSLDGVDTPCIVLTLSIATGIFAAESSASSLEASPEEPPRSPSARCWRRRSYSRTRSRRTRRRRRRRTSRRRRRRRREKEEKLCELLEPGAPTTSSTRTGVATALLALLVVPAAPPRAFSALRSLIVASCYCLALVALPYV